MNRILILLFTCWILGCNIKGQDTKSKRIEKLIKLAEISDSLKDLRRSIYYYTEILKIDSTKPIALINRGRALIWNGQIDEGLADYNKAVMLYPRERTFYIRGMAYVHVKAYDKALPDLQKALALNPTFGEAYYGLSFVEEAEGNLDSALMYCNKAEKNGCPLYQLQQIRAELFEKQKKYQAAIVEMTNLIQREPMNASYFNNRGYDKNQLKQYGEAIKDLDTAIRLDSTMAFAYNNKAVSLFRLNQLNDALRVVNISLQLNKKNAYALKNRGEIYIALNLDEMACSDFTNASLFSQDDNLRQEIKTLQEQVCKK